MRSLDRLTQSQKVCCACLVGALACLTVRFVWTTANEDALIDAAQHGNTNGIRAALALGANPNATFEGDETPLMMAVVNNHLETAELLLRSGADPGPRNWEHRRAEDMTANWKMVHLLRRYSK